MAAGVRLNRLAKPIPPAGAAAQVIHLYGLTQAPGPFAELLRDLKGVDGTAAVEPIACAGLICWISRVPAAEFAGKLSENMQNLDWLAAATTRHQQIVSALAQETDVLPARFGIEFLSEESLRSHIESRRSILMADFSRIRGKEEWGVKVFALPLVSLPKKKIRTGKEYLQAKSALSRRMPAPAGPELPRFAKALRAIAAEVTEGGKFAAASRDLVFHKTILLKRADRKKLESFVRSYARKWKDRKRVECTGPWPPFSFVSQPESSG
jgi:Gas vesicle synthesis protein GvpL/GvpF